jgi:hypothetical protein
MKQGGRTILHSDELNANNTMGAVYLGGEQLSKQDESVPMAQV